GITERLAYLLHGHLLRGIAAGLFGDADQDFGGTAELLQLDLAQTERLQGRAHVREVGYARVGTDLQQHTALEIDPEVQSVTKEQRDRHDRQRRRNRKTDATELCEIEMRVVGHDAQWRKDAKRTDYGQHDNEGAKGDQNQMG